MKPTTPEAIATLWRQATALHQRGQLAQAALLYKDILRFEPDHLEALNLLGMIAGQRGELEQALSWIDRALRVNTLGGRGWRTCSWTPSPTMPM